VAAALLWAAPAAEARSVVIAFLPGPNVFERLAARQGLSIGFVNATQGAYTRRQTLLDMSAGTRVSRSGYDPRDVPRYELAFEALTRGLMPVAALVCAVLAVIAVVRRRTLYAPIARYPASSASLAGGLAGSVAGALANDSGPVLLVVGVLGLGFATAYVHGEPRSDPLPTASR
jgi:hypothetical protein